MSWWLLPCFVSAPRWPLEALPGEASPVSAHEASVGVREPQEWREPGKRGRLDPTVGYRVWVLTVLLCFLTVQQLKSRYGTRAADQHVDIDFWTATFERKKDERLNFVVKLKIRCIINIFSEEIKSFSVRFVH